METNCTYLPYSKTKSFSTIVVDYLAHSEKLQQFYAHPPTIDGIAKAIDERRNSTYNRELLVTELHKQYSGLPLTSLQQQHLDNLLQANTFTICTAHQPNIFTGHLYFIYKIIHAIKLADELKNKFPKNNFVPVYYMGSEDADLDELGYISINGKEYKWQTTQTGAVGRMKVDKAFITLIDEMEGQLSVLPFGSELMQLFRDAYREGIAIQQATLQLVNWLFSEMGLLVLIPDNAELKRSFNSIVKKELTTQFSYPLVQETTEQLSANYKVQASGRQINLFYLVDDIRERIEKDGDKFGVISSNKQWTTEEILREVDEHPERFSANVILRGVFQEMILPNIAFIGGGGEIAYWLELKAVFEACNVPYPVLILRNSFMLVNEQQKLLANKLGFKEEGLFAPADELLNAIIKRNNGVQLSLENEKQAFQKLYSEIEEASRQIDATLAQHTQALQVKQAKLLTELEKKMLRAEKRKYTDEKRQLNKLRLQLFPNNNLQERIDNFSFYYALHGKQWLQKLYEASLSVEQQFCILLVSTGST